MEGAKGHRSYSMLYLTDFILSACIYAPLVVLYWNGTWGLVDNLIYPDNPDLRGAVCFAAGVGILLTAWFSQDALQTYFPPDTPGIIFLPVTRFYIYLVALGNVLHWRGVWKIWNHFSGTDAISGAVCLAICSVLLLPLRGMKNCWGAPLVTICDTAEGMFNIDTRFGRKANPKRILHVRQFSILITLIPCFCAFSI